MANSTLRMTSFAIALLLFFGAPGVNAKTPEPPLACEISRGTWCLVQGLGEIKFTKVPDSRWNKWTLVDTYWKREVGVVLEGARCAESAADTIEVVHSKKKVARDGHFWNEAFVRLRKDKSCELRLMVPADDPGFTRKAANSLSGHVAACIRGSACTENVLSTKVYGLLE